MVYNDNQSWPDWSEAIISCVTGNTAGGLIKMLSWGWAGQTLVHSILLSYTWVKGGNPFWVANNNGPFNISTKNWLIRAQLNNLYNPLIDFHCWTSRGDFLFSCNLYMVSCVLVIMLNISYSNYKYTNHILLGRFSSIITQTSTACPAFKM